MFINLCEIGYNNCEVAIIAKATTVAIIAIITSHRKQWSYFAINRKCHLVSTLPEVMYTSTAATYFRGERVRVQFIRPYSLKIKPKYNDDIPMLSLKYIISAWYVKYNSHVFVILTKKPFHPTVLSPKTIDYSLMGNVVNLGGISFVLSTIELSPRGDRR